VKPVNRWFILIVGMTGTGKSGLTERIIQHERRVLIYDPNREYEGTSTINVSSGGRFRVRTENVDDACDLAFRAGRCLLVLDDAGDFLSHPLPEELEKVVRLGRHREVNLIITGHRIVDLAPLARAQLDAIVSFRSHLPSDLNMLLQYGFDPEVVKNLKIPTEAPWIGEYQVQSLSARGVEHVLSR